MIIERRIYPLKGKKYIQRSNVWVSNEQEAIEYTISEQAFHTDKVVIFSRLDNQAWGNWPGSTTGR